MVLAIGILHKAVPKTLSIQPFWGIFKMLEQCPDWNIVVVECQILGAALLVHPATKSNQHRWAIGTVCKWTVDDAATAQMLQEKVGAGQVGTGLTVAV